MDRRKFVEKLAVVTVAGNAFLSDKFPGYPESTTGYNKNGLPRWKLGKTGVEVPALVIGGVAGMAMKPSADFNPSELAGAALDAGIIYFDTAPAYGDG
jgi:hypothetical protein